MEKINLHEIPATYTDYVTLIRGSVMDELEAQITSVPAFLSRISEARSLDSYAPEKWTIKQVVGHLNDTERIMANRFLRLIRQEASPLPGFDQNAYVHAANFNQLPFALLIDTFVTLRQANMHLFRTAPDSALSFQGTVAGHPLSPGALLYIIAGHTLHHLEIIRQRYLPR